MTGRAFPHVSSHSIVSFKFGDTDWAISRSFTFGMFVSVTTRQRSVNGIVELCFADASTGLLFLELVWAFPVQLLLVFVGDKICQWCEPIFSEIARD